MANPREVTDMQHHVAIGIATSGRRDILNAVLPHVARQDRLPDEIVVCAANAEDVDEEALRATGLNIRLIFAERGLCRQRNQILRNVPEAGILLFLDDDFIMAPSYVGVVERIFASDPAIAMCTGTVDADGILGPGIAVAKALEIIERGRHGPSGEGDPEETVYNAYGCNMAVRMAAVRKKGITFDENLPLYGWLEDVDFSRRMACLGRVVRSRRLRGVHLGTKSGRTSGLRFGYSQIANPIYLMRKKTMGFSPAAAQIARNLAANSTRIFAPEPWVDRKGRLKGNLLAFADLFRGRLAPQNILRLE
jgi:GT2 family glycosyltransferase